MGTSMNIQVSLRSQRAWLVDEQVFLTQGKVAGVLETAKSSRKALFFLDGLWP